MNAFTPIVLLAAAASFASAQPTVTFSYLPEGCVSANDMTPDGRYIVGGWDVNGDMYPDGSYIYDTVLGTVGPIATGLTSAGVEPGVAISDDGTIIAGNLPDLAGATAARWTDASDWNSVGFIDTCGSRSSGWEISGDGSTIVGLAWTSCSGIGFKWTQAGGMVPLEHLFNGNNRASVVNNDGTIIGGFAQGTQNRTPAYWDGTTGAGTLIDPTGISMGEIRGMTNDGSVLLLSYWDHYNQPKDFMDDAYKWTAAGGLELIGDGSIIGGWSGMPFDIADETGTVVGMDFLVGNRRAWIQYEGVGPCQELVTFIESHGGDVPDGQPLQVCQSISDDGTTIIGHTQGTRAWMVTIEDGCDVDFNNDGFVDSGDISVFISAFLSQDPAADMNNDGFLDSGDITVFVAAFIAGC